MKMHNESRRSQCHEYNGKNFSICNAKTVQNIKSDFYLDVYVNHLIHNMDHMRIWGTKPSSVILSQSK